MRFETQRKIVLSILLIVGVSCIAVSVSCGGYSVLEGPPGPEGPPGRNGNDGLSIVSTVTGDTSGLCSNGGSIILMAQDTDQDGAWSPSDQNQSSVLVCNGSNGAAGANAALSVVNFCSTQTVYPSAFSEVGLCIADTLYAVYWDSRNAWLTEIPPGNYRTTSTSVPCNFTVATNCQVSH